MGRQQLGVAACWLQVPTDYRCQVASSHCMETDLFRHQQALYHKRIPPNIWYRPRRSRRWNFPPLRCSWSIARRRCSKSCQVKSKYVYFSRYIIYAHNLEHRGQNKINAWLYYISYDKHHVTLAETHCFPIEYKIYDTWRPGLMVALLQTTFSNDFSSMKKSHWIMFSKYILHFASIGLDNGLATIQR